MRGISARQSSQSGFSLIELSIVLSIVGIITAGIWFGISAVNQHNITMQAEQELILVKNGVIAKAHGIPFPASPNGVYLLTPSLITLGIIPSWAVVSPNQAGAPWALTQTTGEGGTFFVYESQANQQGTSASQFRVSFYNPPSYACIDLLLKATNCTAGSQGCPLNVATDFTPNGQYTTPDPTTGWAIMTPAAAATLCALNPRGSGSVEFWYSL